MPAEPRAEERLRVLVAMDSFKGSLTSRQAGLAVRTGLLRAVPEARVRVLPVADGGEGTTEALTEALGGRLVPTEVTGPYGDPVTAEFGLISERKLAVAEMASAAGLTLSPRREPLSASTFGVGELIGRALDAGCRNFLIGIGGSATNDGGLGMLSALGFRFWDDRGEPVGVTAAELGRIARVDLSGVRPELGECRFRIACDVTNPLCGETGATRVFGPQKGVTEDLCARLDADLGRFADVIAAAFGRDDRDAPGAGAAGGLGFAFLTCLGGELERGIDLVLDALGWDDLCRDADFVVTGEGRLDDQTAFGKTPAGVARRAKSCGVPVIALAGSVRSGAKICREGGIDAWFSALPELLPPEEVLERHTAQQNLAATAEQVFRLIRLARRGAV